MPQGPKSWLGDRRDQEGDGFLKAKIADFEGHWDVMRCMRLLDWRLVNGERTLAVSCDSAGRASAEV